MALTTPTTLPPRPAPAPAPASSRLREAERLPRTPPSGDAFKAQHDSKAGGRRPVFSVTWIDVLQQTRVLLKQIALPSLFLFIPATSDRSILLIR